MTGYDFLLLIHLSQDKITHRILCYKTAVSLCVRHLHGVGVGRWREPCVTRGVASMQYGNPVGLGFRLKSRETSGFVTDCVQEPSQLIGLRVFFLVS